MQVVAQCVQLRKSSGHKLSIKKNTRKFPEGSSNVSNQTEVLESPNIQPSAV